MKRKVLKYKVVSLLFIFGICYVQAQTDPETPPATVNDPIELPYSFDEENKADLFLNNSETQVIYDDKTGKYLIVEKIGDYTISRPIYMTREEYQEYQLKKDMMEYYKEKLGAVSGKTKDGEDAQKDLLPTYYVNSKFFESIFGGNTIEVNPQGSVSVRMGMLFQKVDNPLLSARNRKSTTFDFDQQVSASFLAKIGTRLQVSANYDTQSTFNFQNILKLEYAPTEDDILQKIEVGNVSMPLKNSLINGAQNLFGFKTQLKFGNTTVTGVFSEQKSETKVVAAEGGATVEEFEFQATDYEANRHFFLAHEFRNNYGTDPGQALSQMPLINSRINIVKMEVWVTNRNASTEDFRTIVALADIGEASQGDVGQNSVVALGGQNPSNNGNTLNQLLTPTSGIRNISTASSTLTTFGLEQARDYTILENARKLNPNEYSFHPQLGYLTLDRQLVDSEVLGVAYEYTLNGDTQVYKVGELSTDGVIAPDALAVKMLRGEILNTEAKVWDLMMKNVYNLGAYQMNPDGFRLELMYRNDETGVPTNQLQNAAFTNPSNDELTIMNLLHMDQLDQNQANLNNGAGDGYFDWVEGITIVSQQSLIIFPDVEPFGEEIRNYLTNDTSNDNYVFEELYTETQIVAKTQYQVKDKYLVKGYYKSENSGGIPLGAFNIPQGSVTVTAGGRELVEGVDYTVDYQIGRVKIINPSLANSNTPIQVSVESNSLFNLQTKRFIGFDVEHKFSENFLLGASYLNLRERPITQKAVFGSEPVNNTLLGVNLDFSTEVPIFTKWVNHLPNIDTEATSNFSIKADFAHFIPSTPKRTDLNGRPTSYIDDFEGSQTPLDMKAPSQWFMSATPEGQSQLIEGSDAGSGLEGNTRRGKLAWYSIDQLFYGSSTLQPDNIDDQELSRSEVRRINYSEVFPEQELDLSQTSLLRTLDLAFYPHERGSYNDNPDYLNTIPDPENSWGGITRALTTTNFEQSNVEYIQFWMMDPFQNYSITAAEGLPQGVDPNNPSNQVGSLYINLGNISEDVVRDERKMYENGMPENEIEWQAQTGIDPVTTTGGNVPNTQSLLYAFSQEDGSRPFQDVGLDGARDEDELNSGKYTGFPTEDPAGDNYVHFRDGKYDDGTFSGSILSRYKAFNNTEGNSPISVDFSATTYPDVEDINKDQTMSKDESYYQYEIPIGSASEQYIVDEKEVNVTLEDGQTQTSRWIQYRIPVSSPSSTIGTPTFQSIRFMRMFMTGFKMPVVLRFADLQLVRGEWRRYLTTLDENNPPTDLPTLENENFEVGVVNLQENEDRSPVNYILPPGVQRERYQGSSTVLQQNEQAISVKVKDLKPEKARGIYKNVQVDMRIFKNLEMFIHSEPFNASTLADGDITAIIRLGSDLNDNFYQIEVPLNPTITSENQLGTFTADDVWKNQVLASLETLTKIKLERERNNSSSTEIYPALAPIDGDVNLRVKGYPNLSNIRTIMLAIRNDATEAKSAEVWMNELRVSDYDNDGGWAAVVNADANFADFANFSVTGRMETIGFGGIEERVNQRNLEETKLYDAVANFNLGMLLPQKWGINLPLSYGIAETFKDPKYDAKFQDILFDDVTEEENLYKENSRDYTKRRSLSLINVRKERTNPEKKQRFYDVENVSVSYAHNETYHRDYSVENFVDKDVRASANYAYSFQPLEIEPFKNSTFLSKKYLKLIKDFNINLLPSSIAVNTNINRTYNEQKYRSLVPELGELPELKQRRYLFDWDYNLGYNITKSLNFNFNASNNNIYDTWGQEEDIQIYNNFFDIGRRDHYHQTFNATYNLPLNKIPFLDFVKATYAYTADFDWQRASISYEAELGNTIQNSNTHNWTGDLNMKKFYKGIGLDKLLLNKGKKKKKKKVADKNTVTSINAPTKPQKKKKKVTIGSVTYDILTMVKKVRVNYAENNGTFLPGYIPQVGFLGRDNYSGGYAPNFGFVFGGQYDNILAKAVNNNWLVNRIDDPNDPTDDNNYISKTFSKTHYNTFDYNVQVKPMKGLDIDLIGNKVYTRQESQQIDVVNGVLQPTLPYNVGNFSISSNMIRTSFTNNDANFQEFKDARQVIANRLSQQTGYDVGGYGVTNQDVMLPAFVAAYTGESSNSVSLSAFRDIPIPSWRLTYKGLMNNKWFKKRFQSFTISHGYNSTYVIQGFNSNLQYITPDPSDPVNYPQAYQDASGNWFSQNIYSSATLAEQFNPLVKVDVKLKNSFSFKGQINKDRSLNLNFGNNTLTQINGTEYKVGLGYRIKDVKLKMRIGGEKTTFKGDLNMSADFSLRDNLTLIRSVDVDNDQITGGQTIYSLTVKADYALTKNLTSSFYFEQLSSKYAISTTFPRSSIQSGINIRYEFGN